MTTESIYGIQIFAFHLLSHLSVVASTNCLTVCLSADNSSQVLVISPIEEPRRIERAVTFKK